MKRLTNRLFTIILAAVLLVAVFYLLPTQAEAATSGYYTYTVSNGEATIMACDTSVSGNITIPSTLNGYPVTGIGECAFKLCSNLSSITIPNGVVSIGEYAFDGCSNLTSVTIPDSVTSIGVEAFYRCSSLTSIFIPNSVTSIGRNAFFGCSSLSSVTIPSSVTSIGSGAFSYCSNLTSIAIPSSVSSIGENAFFGCDRLANVYYSGTAAQWNNLELDSSTSPLTTATIHYVSGKCGENLTWSLDNNTLTISGKGAMTTWAYIEDTPWYSLRSEIQSVVIENNVTSIGSGAFGDFPNLSSVTIPNSVTSIGGSAFWVCPKLTSITIPNGVTTIGGYAFCYCINLTSVTIPSSVTNIYSYAFSGCGKLADVYYGSTAWHWNNIELENDNDCLTNATIHYSAFCTFGHTLDEDFVCINCGMGGKCGENLTWMLDNNTLTISGEGDMPDWTAGNAPWAKHTNSITKIVINSGATSIGENAFTGCSAATELLVPATVKSISASLLDCSALKNLYFGGREYNWSLLEVELPDSCYVHYQVASAADHWTDKTVAATCTKDGYTCQTCACGYEINVTVSETASGHTWSEATCTAPKTCSVCTTTEGEPINHNYANRICTGCQKAQQAVTIISASGKETEYDTVEAAASAAKDGDTIRLNEMLRISRVLVFTSGNITLDLNGYSLRVENGKLYDVPMIRIKGATLTLMNSSTTGGYLYTDNGDTSSVWGNNECCVVSVESGKFIQVGGTIYDSNKEYAIVILENGAAELKGGSSDEIRSYGAITMDGIKATAISAYAGSSSQLISGSANAVTNSGTMTISGGSWSALSNYDSGQLEITGGNVGAITCYGMMEIKGDAVISGKMKVTVSGTASISGGTFTGGIAVDENYKYLEDVLAEGYAFFDGSRAYGMDHPYVDYGGELAGNPNITVVPVDEVIVAQRIEPDGSTSLYVSVEEALSAGQQGTVKLLTSVTLGYNASVNTEEILNLNKKVLTVPADKQLVIQGVLMLNGGSVNGSYTFGTNSGAIGGSCGSDVYWKFREANSTLTLYGAGAVTKADWSAYADKIANVIIEADITALCSNAFAGCGNLEITFQGNAPSFAADAFDSITATCYYPGAAEGWETIENQDFGGSITWMPYCTGEHSWSEATCTTPAVCLICGETGELGDHDWQDATCSAAETCSLCSETRGEINPTNHIFDADTHACACGIYGGTCGESLTWTLVEGALTITGDGAMTDWADNADVPWAQLRDEIQSVTIEDGVTSIGNYAFAYCSSLTGATLPTSITSIGKAAFDHCEELTDVVIPDSVTSVGERAFLVCKKLTSITIPSRLTSISGSMFAGCGGLTSVTIPSSVTSIGDNAFLNCRNLTSITIPNSVTKIESYAFNMCTGLTDITLSNNLTIIGEDVFRECESLSSITIPNGVTSIGTGMFKYCSALTNITIPNSVTSVGNGAFVECDRLETVFFKGTPEEKNAIVIADFSDELTSATWHYGCDNATFGKQECVYCTECDNYYLSDGSLASATVVFKNWDGTVLSTKDYHYGDTVIEPIYPTKPEDDTYTYDFMGWDKPVVACAGDAVYTAVFRERSKLKILTQPQSVTVEPGETAKVSFTATGYSLRYTWYYKNAGATSFSKSSVKTATYSTTMNSTVDGRQVYCEIKDQYGYSITTDTVTLNMKQTAKITTQPESVTATNGSTAKVTLIATGDGLTYTWYYRNAGASSFSKSSVKTATYSTTMNSTVDGRELYCIVKDQYGNTVTSNTVTLTMRNVVKITGQPRNVVAFGTTAKVTVTATGDGLTYQWYYKDADATNFSKSSVKKATYSTTIDSTISGRQVYCVVKDQYGNFVKSTTVTLTKGYAAKITKQPTSAIAANGATVKASVSATGDGLSYTWYYKNAGAASFSKSSVKAATYSTTMSPTVDGRQVYCVVKDKYGNSVQSNTVTLTMGNAITITSQPTSAIAANGATVKTSVSATGNGLTYTWYYKNAGDASFSKSSITKATYATTMNSTVDGRQVYCLVKDQYGNTVQTGIVTLTMGNVAKITKQPTSATAANGATVKASVSATGDGLTYTWYYKNAGAASFSKSSVTKATYSTTMNSTVDGRQIYCIVKDIYGNTVTSQTVTLTIS